MALRDSGKFRWRGTVSGAYNTSGNWVDENGDAWGDGHFPGWDGLEGGGSNVDGDTVMFDAAAVNALEGGDYSAKGDLAKFEVTEAYKDGDGAALDIGSSGTYLQLSMQTTGRMDIDALYAGDMFLKGDGAHGLAAVTVTNTKRTGGTSILYLDGSIARLTSLRGTVTIKAGAVIGAFSVGSMTGSINDVTMVIESGATLPTDVEVNGGQVTNSAATTNLNMTAGRWINSAGNMAYPNVRGGTLQWDAGNITGKALVSNSGLIDGTQSDEIRSIADGEASNGGRFNFETNSDSIDWSAGILCTGGSVDISPGTRIGPM